MSEPNVVLNTQEAIRQHADVVRGHDAVHPDRDACGGVGGCGLMRAECDAEQEVVRLLEVVARTGRALQLSSTATRSKGHS